MLELKLKRNKAAGKGAKQEEEEEERSYTVPQLDDLQSKLMLLAGQALKGNERNASYALLRVIISISARLFVLYG